jgi:serine protease Do
MNARIGRLGFAVLWVCGLFWATGTPPVRAQDMQYGRSALVRGLLPSVVNIAVHRDVPAEDSAPREAAAATTTKVFYGSGFIIDSTGLIVTNYHVVDRAYDIVVTLDDGTKLPATIVNGARVADLALLRVKAGRALAAVHWGDSTKVQVGDPVIAIGNPFGVGQSVTAGIVSALNRDIMDSPYDNFIQTDAAINHGNSGGPLFDMAGDVVGVDTALISPTKASTGLGFAIPANEAHFVVDRLLTYGWVRPGWIGVKVQQVTAEMAAALGMAEPQGAIVSWLNNDGPAARAGVRIGDIILRFSGKQPRDERELLRNIAAAAPGLGTTLDILRGGAPVSVAVTVQEWPRMQWEERDAPQLAQPPHHTIPPDLGLSLAAPTAEARTRLGTYVQAPALLITAVEPGTDAASRGIQAGDILLRIQDHPVGSPAEVMAALDAARAANRPFVMALVLPKTQDMPGPKWFALRLMDDTSTK